MKKQILDMFNYTLFDWARHINPNLINLAYNKDMFNRLIGHINAALGNKVRS